MSLDTTDDKFNHLLKEAYGMWDSWYSDIHRTLELPGDGQDDENEYRIAYMKGADGYLGEYGGGNYVNPYPEYSKLYQLCELGYHNRQTYWYDQYIKTYED